MLFKKNILGRKYIRIIIGKPSVFITFVLLGVGLFLFLTTTTRIDVKKVYSAKVLTLEDGIVLTIKDSNIIKGSGFIYSDKNIDVYPVNIEKAENTNENSILYFSASDQSRIKALATQDIFIEISQGTESLLYRIFVKGGKGRG